MIVVCGPVEAGARGRGMAVTVARRVAALAAAELPGTASVQLISRVADDAAGDRLVLELSAAAIDHAALLRGPSPALESADIELALRYLPNTRVAIGIQLDAAGARALAEGAAYAEAAGLVLVGGDAPDVSDIAPGAIVLDPPPADPDETFAAFVATLAVRLAAGDTPADAWAETVRRLAADPTT